MDRPSWDQMYIMQCYVIAQRSPDESTKVGSVITTRDHVSLVMGYNGLPRGVPSDEAKYQERPGKYLYFEHAERNAIYNAARIGVRMDLAHTLYVTWLPCSDCARAIIQTGIQEIVVHRGGQLAFDSTQQTQWNENQEAALEMLKLTHIDVRWYDGPLIARDLYGVFSGQKFTFNGDEGFCNVGRYC